MTDEQGDATPRSSADDLDGFMAQSLEGALSVNDLDASIAWYRDVVGFRVDREFRREGRRFAVRMRGGLVRLLLNQDNGAKGAARSKGEGISFQLTTTQDIDQLAARITSRGGVLASEPADVMGARAFRVVDPDGFRFAISAPRDA
jgi:predicted enzyme related to lactoylglutathione lyase